MKKILPYIVILLIVICILFAVYELIFYHEKTDFYKITAVETAGEDIVRPDVPNSDNKPSQKDKKISAPADVIDIDSVETYERLSQYGKLSHCLQGTQIDGGLFVDEQGKLIISQDIKRLFDYFLSAAHEEGVEISIARIKEYIQLTLPHDTENEALAILHDYLDYKNNLKRFNHEGLSELSKTESLAELKAAIEDREQLRRQYMNPEVVDAFFSAEEAYDHYNLGRMEIEYDDTLTAQEKKEMVNQLDEQLPEGMRDRRRYMAEESELKKTIAKLKQQEGSEDIIHELRESFYGKKAADGLAELDKKRKDLENRFNTFYESRERILESSELSDDEKRQQIHQMKLDSFSNAELIKVDIYEKIRDQKKSEVKEP